MLSDFLFVASIIDNCCSARKCLGFFIATLEICLKVSILVSSQGYEHEIAAQLIIEILVLKVTAFFFFSGSGILCKFGIVYKLEA